MNFLGKLVQKKAVYIVIVAGLLSVFGAFYGRGVFEDLKTDQGGLRVNGSNSQKAGKYISENFSSDEKKVIILARSEKTNMSSPIYMYNLKKAMIPFEQSGATLSGYFNTGSSEFATRDRKETFVIADFSNKTEDFIYEFVKKQPTKQGELEIDYGGSLMASRQITHQIEQDLMRAEIISLPILLVFLIVIFRSITAAVLPIILGLISIVGGASVVRLLTQFVDIDQYAINIITVLGLALSIDYSLLMVSRFREELLKNKNKKTAIKNTINSSGRTIFFSGLTVMICLLGLTLFPISFLSSVGYGGIAALLVAIIASLTVLPSMLLLMGHHINRGSLNKAQLKLQSKRLFERWQVVGRMVIKKPYLSIFVAILIISIAALPLLHINIKSSGFDYRSLPIDSGSREVSKVLEKTFHQKTPSLQLVYLHGESLDTPSGYKKIQDFTNYLSSMQGVSEVKSLTSGSNINPSQLQILQQIKNPPKRLVDFKKHYINEKAAFFEVYTKKDSSSDEAQAIVKELRDKKIENTRILVNGAAAIEYDIRAAVIEKSIIALGFVVVAMIVLLSLLLRSVIIPVQAIIINSFSLLAAFGILVWIFQDNFLNNLGWFSQTGSLDLTILVLIFAVTLGLSMDYATFYYSRAREEYDKSNSTDAAIIDGLSLTGPVITQAAILLFVVVVAFAASNIAFLQQIGTGLALAVLVDAFVVRVVLVPAVMKITGKANWYAPRFLKQTNIKHDKTTF